MTDKLPPNLLNLFAPRPPLRWVEPTDHAPEERHTPYIGGIGQYMEALREYKNNDGYVPTESWLQKHDRKKLEKKEKQEKLLSEGINECMTHRATPFLIQYISDMYTDKPSDDPKVQGDAFKTLFVSRLAYGVTSEDLEREFGRYGPIERIRIVEDTTAPPDAPPKKRKRGYAFIVYEREKDMKGNSPFLFFLLPYAFNVI
jgi:U1 small nuclear ribonucleoprotein 70kDa